MVSFKGNLKADNVCTNIPFGLFEQALCCFIANLMKQRVTLCVLKLVFLLETTLEGPSDLYCPDAMFQLPGGLFHFFKKFSTCNETWWLFNNMVSFISRIN